MGVELAGFYQVALPLAGQNMFDGLPKDQVINTTLGICRARRLWRQFRRQF